MLVVISPAKKLDITGEKPDWFSTPQFVDDAEKLIVAMRKKKSKELEKLMNISSNLAELNFERYMSWNRDHKLEDSKQAVFTFTGEVYSGLNVTSYQDEDLKYAQDHLRILSGLYGLLKPMDLIHAYRLEMGTKLKLGRKSNLYEFWGDRLVNEINNTIDTNGSNVLVNLASNEYFNAVNKKKLKANIVTPIFKDFNNGKYKTVMVYAKKARGLMASYIMKNKLKDIEDLMGFDIDGYYFNKEASSENEMVFYRG